MNCANTKIKIGIAGYGNLARGVESAIAQNPDTELCAVFTRRDPKSVIVRDKNAAVLPFCAMNEYTSSIDVIINCGGSATDLPKTTPMIAENFCVIDSFDTHAKIPSHFENTDKAARRGGKLAIISVGWDPGMFSTNRLFANSILPDGKDYTFWGRGISQGHSDAIRRIDGVEDARQYTVPIKDAYERVKNGETPGLSVREKHRRECYVVAKDGADKQRIEYEIKNMTNYFAGYDTTVTFISKEELIKDHSGMPHGGSVIRNGKTGYGEKNAQTIEYSLRLGSNPEFTGSVLVCYARAAKRLFDEGKRGCLSVFDVAPSYLSPLGRDEIISRFL